jgi:hypothetical protein
VSAPLLATFNPEEFNVKVSSEAFPIVIVLAATPVPIKTEPVEPESRVKLLAPVADLIVSAPESEILFAERVWVDALTLKPLIVLDVAAEIVEASVSAPVDVILFDAEKNCISPVEVPARVRVPEPLAEIERFSLIPEERVVIDAPAPAAADLICIPVAEVAVEAST